MKRAAIIQSNYIPWKGYFHIINSVDVFIFLDSVQYTSRDWRNRNRIITSNGSIWLTVPVSATGKLIKEKKIISGDWQEKHFQTFKRYYCRSPFWEKYLPFLEELYLHKRWNYLSDLNQFAIRRISEYLGISTSFLQDSELTEIQGRNERIIHLLKQIEADVYVSGPAALAYLDEKKFDKNGIKLEIFNYPEYKVYPQLWGKFQHEVSILDMLLNLGDETGGYIWGGGI
ncbi:MAG: WbqC family protein [Candidatus Cloacimonetes bacterium]|nr:WbqC family protein [Candidatus Cloacimonadota bacterium]